jgi:4-hydroxybenzoate polyprenyltransferase
VKSTAILFGSWVKPILGLFSAVFVGTLVYAGLETNQGWIYFTVSVGGCAAHLWWQLGTLDVEVPDDCGRKFDVSA